MFQGGGEKSFAGKVHTDTKKQYHYPVVTQIGTCHQQSGIHNTYISTFTLSASRHEIFMFYSLTLKQILFKKVVFTKKKKKYKKTFGIDYRNKKSLYTT